MSTGGLGLTTMEATGPSRRGGAPAREDGGGGCRAWSSGHVLACYSGGRGQQWRWWSPTMSKKGVA